MAPSDEDARTKVEQITSLQQKLAAEAAKNKEAAVALTDQRGRESEQLAEIIEQEEIKAVTTPPIVKDPVNASPSVGSTNVEIKEAQAEMEVDVRPGAPVGPIIISDEKVGEEARNTQTGRMTENEKFDGMMKRSEQDLREFQASEEMKALLAKYPDRKTTEIEKVGNSIVTWVYMNRGVYITTFKKIQHNWGGIYYFVDGQATNQRFWEHETQ